MSDLMRIFVSLALVAVSTYASMAQHVVFHARAVTHMWMAAVFIPTVCL